MTGAKAINRRDFLKNTGASALKASALAGASLAAMPVILPKAAHARASLFIAAASSLRPVLSELRQDVPALKRLNIRFAWGATGKLATQIINGAPFDLFFAADAIRPALLQQKGIIPAACRRTFALGRLCLFAADGRALKDAPAILREGRFRHLAMANPRHAPYGRAARETLMHLGLWESIRPKIVYGENVGQAFQFLRAGAAELGFVALSQVLTLTGATAPNLWLVPQRMHHPLAQQVVILRPSREADAFLHALHSRQGMQILRRFGYDAPPTEDRQAQGGPCSPRRTFRP